MSTGLKANSDGSAAIQVGGTDFLTVTSGGNTTFTQPANLPNTFCFKNRIINGAMVIDQRNAGASVTPSGGSDYTLDRWMLRQSIASKFSIQQNAPSLGSVTPPVGYTNYLGATVVSAYSITSNDFYDVRQLIEGYNIADLGWGTANAQAVTISFWVRSSLTGTFGGAVSNGSTRSYPFTYLINSANTWEQKTITISGDTSGTWLTTNGIGIRLHFGLGVGSSYAGTAGAWAASNFISATGATSVVGTNGATFYITGVQLEKGSTATSFDYRPYGTELALCQRYYQRYDGNSKFVGSLGSAVTTGEFDMCFPLPVAMRSAPTMNYANLQITDGAGTNFTPSSFTTFQASTTTAGFYMGATGLTSFRPYFLRTLSSAGYLDASSEL